MQNWPFILNTNGAEQMDLKTGNRDLFRTGVNYSLRKDVNLIAGYAFAQTYSYGDYPAAFAFPEHRIFEQVLIKNPIGKVDLSHRFMLEQRFVGRLHFKMVLKKLIILI